jgi:DHA1 family bicyclomycin/chloramphenicol resistance-like MFS transporter
MLILVLGLLTALGPVSIDLYLPAFPALRQDLHAGDAAVQLTLTGMTVGLAVGQLLIGAWSDRVGRRRPLLLSCGLHLVATIGCVVAPSIGVLAACRVAQGAGAAGSAVLVLAIVRDRAEGKALVTLLSRVALVTTLAPLLAPVAGAEILAAGGWRGVFVVLAVASALLLVAAAVVVPETGRPAPPRRLGAVLGDRRFRQATLVAAMTYAGIYAYVAASPLLLQNVYGLSPRTYAVVFLVNSLGLVLGVQLASTLIRRYDTPRVLTGFAGVTVVAAAAIVPLQWPGVLVCLFVFVAGCGGCFPCAEGLALHDQGEQSGTASSVHGFATFGAAGLVAPLPGLIGVDGAGPLALVLLATSATAVIGAARMARPAHADRR